MQVARGVGPLTCGWITHSNRLQGDCSTVELHRRLPANINDFCVLLALLLWQITGMLDFEEVHHGLLFPGQDVRISVQGGRCLGVSEELLQRLHFAAGTLAG